MFRTPSASSRRVLNRAAAAVMEPMDGRQLYTATLIDTGVMAGALVIRGSDKADKIELAHSLGSNGTQLDVIENGKKTGTFKYQDLKTITADLGKGDDKFFGQVAVIPTIVHGGDGDDSVFTGWGNDTLNGGKGNDTLVGNAGRDLINGNAGNDSINGGDDDNLYGDEGADRLSGENGSDGLYGGRDANDMLYGGGNRDRYLIHMNKSGGTYKTEDKVADKTGYDVNLRFWDDFAINNSRLPNGEKYSTVTIKPTWWKENDVERVDAVLSGVSLVGNGSRILSYDGSDVDFWRAGQQTAGKGVDTWSWGRTNAFLTDGAFTNTERLRRAVTGAVGMQLAYQYADIWAFDQCWRKYEDLSARSPSTTSAPTPAGATARATCS